MKKMLLLLATALLALCATVPPANAGLPNCSPTDKTCVELASK